jgi:hypothetical protein
VYRPDPGAAARALAGPTRGALDSSHPGDAPAGLPVGPGRGQEGEETDET